MGMVVPHTSDARAASATQRLMRLGRRLASTRAASTLVLDPLLRLGWRRYLRRGTTPYPAFRAMRLSFANPSDSAFQRLELRASREYPALRFPANPDGLVHDIHDEILATLNRDGFAVLPRLLDSQVCEEIQRCAEAADCTFVNASDTRPSRARFDAGAPVARRYDVPEADLVACNAVQELIADESLLRLGQSYLQAAPVQDLVAAWWSVRGPGSSNQAAQQFHFDLDRPRFLKAFFYITDVGPDNGPHTFVRGTHRTLPPEFRDARRYTDHEVEQRFSGDIVRICGPRGTVFLADTRALHKGEPVMEGHRLVFQLELAMSLFGAQYTSPLLSSPSPALVNAAGRYPHVFRRFRWAELA